MAEDQTGIDPEQRSWIGKLKKVLSNGRPSDLKGLLELLRDAKQSDLLDADTCGIIEGALQVSTMQVRDIMIPRSRSVLVSTSMPVREMLEMVAGASHSRFPVIEGNVDNVIGILLAKDLLPLCLTGIEDGFKLKKIIRPATFVPESRQLNVLLKEFREQRSHMAIIVDD